MNRITPICVASALLLTTGAANAQFTGDYAPDTWTVTGAGLGPSAAEFATDGSSLTITGPDLVAGEIDVTHTVALGGTWSFDWLFFLMDPRSGFDNSYYLLNGTPVFLSGEFVSYDTSIGSERIPVNPGDVIGWRVHSVDGLFGPGILTLTNFEIPAPGAFVLLGFAGVCRARRRRG